MATQFNFVVSLLCQSVIFLFPFLYVQDFCAFLKIQGILHLGWNTVTNPKLTMKYMQRFHKHAAVSFFGSTYLISMKHQQFEHESWPVFSICFYVLTPLKCDLSTANSGCQSFIGPFALLNAIFPTVWQQYGWTFWENDQRTVLHDRCCPQIFLFVHSSLYLTLSLSP